MKQFYNLTLVHLIKISPIVILIITQRRLKKIVSHIAKWTFRRLNSIINMNANNEEFDTTKCAACGKSANDDVKLKQCSACKLVAYCNVTCQKAHRKEHKEDCKREVRFARRRARMQHECVYSFEPGWNSSHSMFQKMT